MSNNEIIIYEDNNGDVKLKVEFKDEMIWLSRNQIAELFNRDVKTIGKHIANSLREELEGENGCVAKFATQLKRFDPRTGKDRIANVKVSYYSLDVIQSVGYRVKSKKGIVFRKWANTVLKQYLLEGYAINQKRLDELKLTVDIMRRAMTNLDSKQVLDVIEAYTKALSLLDNYDHDKIEKPHGSKSIYELSYEECKQIIESMKPNAESELFGREIDDSLDSIIGAIYQTFDGEELYPSLEEKAANLLYFVVKDHKVYDGNKRIGAAIFLYFLDKNRRLFIDNKILIENDTLVALVIMIAESKPEEKNVMINLVMTFLID